MWRYNVTQIIKTFWKRFKHKVILDQLTPMTLVLIAIDDEGTKQIIMEETKKLLERNYNKIKIISLQNIQRYQL